MRLLIGLFVTCLAAEAASAQTIIDNTRGQSYPTTNDQVRPSPTTQSFQNENILVPLPSGFKIGATWAPEHQRLVEFVPKGETVQNWTRMVTEQIVFGLRDGNPDQMPTSIAKGWAVGCPGGTGQKVAGGSEHGYPVSVWMFTCPLNPTTHMPESMWIKTLSGADSFYSVQYAYRAEPSREMVLSTMSSLKEVAICDTRKPDRLCPSVN